MGTGVVGLVEGDLGVEVAGGGAVPVVLVRPEVDAVAGTDLFDRAALALDQADSLGDEDRLADRMGVCQAVRAPGAKRTIPPRIRDGGVGEAMTSMWTDPANQSPGPTIVSSAPLVICISSSSGR